MRSIQNLLGEAKGKMNGYLTLLMLRYGNLCVKADATALMSTTVTINDQDNDLESVAHVGILQEDVFAVAPKESAYIQEIGKGVMKSHPEFIMELVHPEGSTDNEDDYLTFKMPEVDDARHAMLMTGVETLNAQCATKLNAVFTLYSAKIATKMVGQDPKTIEEVTEMLKEVYDFYNDTCKSQTDTKKQEIEDAYQKFLAEREAKMQEKKEEAAAHSKEATQQMKMGSLGEDEY